jgi:type II secretory pathway pseudopilin PulG
MNKRGLFSRKNRRGFTMVIVVLVLALLVIIGSIVLSQLTSEQKNAWLARLSSDSTNVAEGGFMEVLDDSNLLATLPSYTSPSLQYTYTDGTNCPSQSLFCGRAATTNQSPQTYRATISLVRTAPIQESGISLVRAFVYEVSVVSNINNNQQTGEVDGELFRVFSVPTGTVLPSLYAR